MRYVLQATDAETAAIVWSCICFFCLLCSYTILRPVRDEMPIRVGISNLPLLLTAVVGAMLVLAPIYGWLSSRFRRAHFVPAVYFFFAAQLACFWIFLSLRVADWGTAATFFVWVSVFNVFVVSVFWSVMADVFSVSQGRRFYGFVAAGGTAGAIAGQVLTVVLVKVVGTTNLLLLSGLFLVISVVSIGHLFRTPLGTGQNPSLTSADALGGPLWSGMTSLLRSPYLLGIGAYVTFYTAVSTYLYFSRAEAAGQAIQASENRILLFAASDLAVSIGTLFIQLVLFRPLLRTIGILGAVCAMPLLSMIGLSMLGLVPTLTTIVVFGIAYRVVEFGIAKPARETLFNALSPEEKYKAKNVIDTLVYRLGDTTSAWAVLGMRVLGVGIAAGTVVLLPIVVVWAVVSVWLARLHERTLPELRFGR
jgi:AAA family ATP:ADP antiporter